MQGAGEYHEVVSRIRDILNLHQLEYTLYEHQPVRTSEEAAKVRPEYRIEQGAKSLIVRVKRKGVSKEKEKQFVEIVVPGNMRFVPALVRDALNVKDIRFATPEEVDEITGGVQPGGVPPFGNLFGLPVYVEESLLKESEIIFNAGDRRVSIVMNSKDYQLVVDPVVVRVIE